MRPALRLAVLGAAELALSMVHCSSRQGSTLGGGVTGTPQNESEGGVVYPTTNIGTAQRGLDGNGNPKTLPGSVIANYKFLGYPGADTSKGLQPVSLADYYDPTATKHKLLHIMAAGEWCNPCTTELLSDLANPATNFEAQGVAILQVLTEGNTVNLGATQADLNDWIGKLHPTFTEVLDPEASNLGVFFNEAALPFNADIDVRSMEVLQAGTGQENPAAVTVWINWVKNNPAAYPPQ